MPTRTHTGRMIEVPDVTGQRAERAIQQIRALALMPITYSTAVDNVEDAGFVVGLDPPAGSPVRPKSPITISVATHPDFQGHADQTIVDEPDVTVQTFLTWPYNNPPRSTDPEVPSDPQLTTTAPSADVDASGADPDQLSQSAAAPLDAVPLPMLLGDHATLVAPEPLQPVPTPDQIADEVEWERVRDREAERERAQAASSATTELRSDDTLSIPTPDELQWERVRAQEAEREAAAAGFPSAHSAADLPLATVALETDAQLDTKASDQQARRDARRRRARRHRHLTFKQKALVGVFVAATILLVAAAMSHHHPTAQSRTAAGASPTPPAVSRTHTHRSRAPRGRITRTATPTRPHRPATHHHRPRPTHAAAHAQRRTFAVTAHPVVTSAPSSPPITTTPVTSSAPTGSSGAHQSSPTPTGRKSQTGTDSTPLQSPGGTTAPPQP